MTAAISRRSVLGGALGGGLALFLASCSSAVEEARQSGSGDATAGGTLVIGSLSDLVPTAIFSQSITSMTIGGLVYDTLIRIDRSTGDPTPSVATEWDVSEDGLIVRLTLRDDVVFHTGRPLTSRDVAYTLTNLAKDTAASQLQATAGAITSIDTSDDHVAMLTLAHPLVNLFDLLEFALLTDSESEAALLAGDSFVGTGPFRFDSWTRGSESVWVRNENYWGGASLLDGVTVRVVRDSTALLASVRSGQADALIGVNAQDARQFRDGFRIENEDVFDVAYYVGANVENPALADTRVRRAISYAVDRERILAEVLGGVGIASSSPWPETSPAYDEEATARYTRDQGRARELLAEVGGATPTLTLSYGTGLAPAALIAAIVQNDLAEVGIEVTLDPREQAEFSPFLLSGQHQLWINPHGFGQSSPSTLATGAAPFKPVGNLSRFSSEAYARAVDEVWKQPDPQSDDAKAAYEAFTDILLDEQFVVELVIGTNTNVYRSALTDVDWNLYKNLRLEKTYFA